MTRILIATHNPGKLLEYQALLSVFPFTLVTLNDLGIREEPEEDSSTFEGNARIKVNFYGTRTDLPFLAEDSGLEIDALGGEPGVHSRRWGGEKRTDDALLALTFQKLKHVPPERRGAQFRVVIGFRASPKREALFAEGVLRGILLDHPIAPLIPGFPFRSIFYVPALGKTLGELPMGEEGRIGHRKQALKKLYPFLKDIAVT